ncbi:MAG TPA: DUF4160 domain-containing protein [Acidobacteriota bacterium]|jgi:hypothetical protein
MPTVLRHGPYRVYFYSQDLGEPAHVHVDRDDSSAKFWLRPVRLASSRGFSTVEIGKVSRIVKDHEFELINAWKRYFGTGRL